MYKLEFKLKQHTPLIHFQWEQSGATLRATEVKPKLDKYIINKVFNNDFESCKTFLVGYLKTNENELIDKFKEGNVSLNYKLCIRSNSGINLKIGYPKQKRTGEIYWDDQFPCYFGNMGISEPQKIKQFIFDEGKIECSLNINDISLARHLKGSELTFCSFFLINNFGNRQDKGFGSFTISEFNGNPTNYEISKSLYFISENQTQVQDRFTVILNENGVNSNIKRELLSKYYSLFNSIDLFYRTLRSGINIPNKLYFKSMMFFYAKNLEYAQQWDKKTVRKHFYSEHPKYINILNNRDEPLGTVNYTPGGDKEFDRTLFRDLLGLASEQMWKYYDNDIITKIAINNAGDKLQRFKSPITFKPIFQDNKFKVYILSNKIPKIFLGASVEISSKNFGNRRNPLILNIPNSFSVKDYLLWAIRFYYENNYGISNQTRDSCQEMRIIDSIYNQLYKQINSK